MTRNQAAQTAFGPMVLAAVEQYEPPSRRLVDDPLALRFLPPALRALVASARVDVIRRTLVAACERAGPGLWASITCRKRLIDEQLVAAMPDIESVVILGAGMDTRGYRLTAPDVTVFEVDQAVNITRKAAVVRRALSRQPISVSLVPLDFEHDDLAATLAEHGYRSTSRTFFIWEGVTQYLSADAVRATFAQLSDMSPGSLLVFTYIRQDFIDGTDLHGATALYRRFRQRSEVWKSGLRPEEIRDVLSDFGWRLRENMGPKYYADKYVRPAGRHLTISDIEWSAVAEKI
ncbi:class I SAM-dependent methyltransferase [soil metagenome]